MPFFQFKTAERPDSNRRRTGFHVSESVSDMDQSVISKLVLELLDDNRFAVIMTGRLPFVKSSVLT